MARLERNVRDRNRVVRMRISTVYPEGHPLAELFRETPHEKSQRGVFRGEAHELNEYRLEADQRVAGSGWARPGAARAPRESLFSPSLAEEVLCPGGPFGGRLGAPPRC